ncbi:hypothetical protein CYMTET_39091 [Cymbomonas tetramitiformis]|uniref:Uncharacterized protein n=1 Tax=Cymbomonas tetramitiformis TaxID=36881 RepID=A0AAE0F4Z8_9CHLO|nr:hypothetical protein CYMTET_39091 [Cymbomonas tetramitiformis]
MSKRQDKAKLAERTPPGLGVESTYGDLSEGLSEDGISVGEDSAALTALIDERQQQLFSQQDARLNELMKMVQVLAQTMPQLAANQNAGTGNAIASPEAAESGMSGSSVQSRVAGGVVSVPLPLLTDMLKGFKSDQHYSGQDAENDSKWLEFRGLLGQLQWIARCTRLDIMAAVSALSRFCASYGPEHFVALKQVVRYLKGTMSYELLLRTTSSVPRGLGLAGGALPMSIYTDADYAGCKTTRRSTSGIAVYLCGSLLIFSSIMQRCVSLSTTEAEIIAMSEGAREIKYMINVLNDLVDICNPVPMYCDNQGAIHLASDYVNNNRSKHIEVRNMYIRELVKSKTVEASYVSSADNTADIFTKPLPLPAFLTHRERLGIMKMKDSDPEELESED